MQRAGTLRYVGPPRPGPLHHRPAWGNSSKQEPVSQVNRGPKKQSRSCKLNGVDPQRYLTELLTRLVNEWPQARIDALMP